MSLIDDMLEPCVFMNRIYVSDGAGGRLTKWEQGAEFNAAITLNSTIEARIAEKSGVSNVYTVTTINDLMLKYEDVFKRLSDGQVFRVTSNGKDKKTPSLASFAYSRASAEKWELTDE